MAIDKFVIDNNGISLMLELAKSGRNRKVARLYYVNGMTVEGISDLMGYSPSVIVSEIMVINKIIENNISHKTCTQCGQGFYSGSKSSQLCEKCRADNKKESDKRTKEAYKSFARPKGAKRKKFKSISQIEKERAKYNKENGTGLSYGQYVQIMGE